MVHVRIYQPAKTAMQSGRAKTKSWVLEYERDEPQFIEPVMHWTGTTTTKPQVKLKFATQQDAVNFAKRHGWSYYIEEPHSKKFQPKSYADNFKRPA